MGTQAVSPASAQAEVRDSWVPMIVIAMGQMLMSFNVATIPVILGLITVGLGLRLRAKPMRGEEWQ